MTEEKKEKSELLLRTKQETISEGIAFLLEMEQVNSVPVQNAIILNILKLSGHIKEAEIVADQDQRKMLIFLRLGWWGNLWHKREIAEDVISMLRSALPSFEFRVIYDPEILEKARVLAEKMAKLRGRFGPRV
jgi:hypothetical protein